MSEDTAPYDLAVLKAASLVKASRERAALLERIERSIARVTFSRAAHSALEEIEQTHLLIPRLSSVGPDTIVTLQAELRERLARAIARPRNSRHVINQGEPTIFDYERADAVLEVLSGEVSNDE